MKGRLENQLKVERLINKKVSTMPQFIQEYAVELMQNEVKTANVYLNHVIAFLGYLKENKKYNGSVQSLGTLLPKDINDYFFNKLRYTNKGGQVKETSDTYKGVAWTSINNFYKFLLRNNYVSNNPVEGTRRPKQNDFVVKDILTPPEIGTIITKIHNGVYNTTKGANMHELFSSRDMLLFLMMVRTGSRITGLLEINVDEIDVVNKKVHVMSKRRRHIDFPLGDDIIECYKQWMVCRRKVLGDKHQDALFINNRGDRLTYSGAAKCLKKYWGDIDKHITPHTTRTTVGTWVYERTNDIYKVQNVLDHKDITTSLRYIQQSERQNKDTMIMLEQLTK